MLGWFVAATAVVVGGVGLFWRTVGPGLSQQRSAAVGGGEQGRAELSGGAHPPPGQGQWTGHGLGLRPGQSGWSVGSRGGVGGRGRGGGGAGTSLRAAAIY